MVKDEGVESKEGIDAAKEAKATFDKFRPDLTITDVPTKTLRQFKELANEEFKAKGSAAHYGFTLKFLVDFYNGQITEHSLVAKATADEAIERIEKIEERIESMAQEPDEKKNPKERKMLDGSIKRCF